MIGAELSDAEKTKIASDIVLQSPPGEFNEVFNDVRTLLNDDTLLDKGCLEAVKQYNKSQFVTVKLDGVEQSTLVTEHNELSDGRFVDPKSQKTFKYDHLRKEAVEVHPVGSKELDDKHEQWRKILQKEVDEYVHEHFYKTGVAAVFTPLHKEKTIILCIESHQFQPKNFWNGRWRSEWHLPLFDGKATTHKCTGKLRLQVHYYEDGNVQLISEKDLSVDVKLSADKESSAKDIIQAICEAESAYQIAIQESQSSMESTFKTLRRQLPVTRSKLDWLKCHSYRIMQDVKPQ
uniref:F-actin-capping protein subunit alpha n=2 Tax=Meloidogyne TaxID=189290 RepID=A0A6V7ULG5_MELEN|nr:unnamed protein product [Meloidogyne enterolobii]